ncbi:Uncharacterised protein [Mycobacteroides abscessus subsp. abscessus]|nr:Uncharacterised protein [Mycobacteroides abscessus subsp. abscessus]
MVGSSSNTTSNRDNTNAAKPTRAACPPDREVIRVDAGRTVSGPRPRSFRTAGTRSSRSAAPQASQRSNATEYSSAGSVRPCTWSANAAAADSMACVAAMHPVRRAI